MAQVSRFHRSLARTTLWPALGRQYSVDEGTGRIPEDERYEAEYLEGYKTRWIRSHARIWYPDAYQRGDGERRYRIPRFVPRHVINEFSRLKRRGIAADTACTEYGLTHGDLAKSGIPTQRHSRGYLGKAFVYSIEDVVRVARDKHGSAAGLRAYLRQRRRDTARRRAAAKARAAAREEALKVRERAAERAEQQRAGRTTRACSAGCRCEGHIFWHS